MSIALVTHYINPYRLPLYRLLHERHSVETYCFGGEADYVPRAVRDLDAQLANAPFTAHRLPHQRDAAAVAERHDAVVATVTGKVALPAAYFGARRARKPFILWTSLWRHPRTAQHVLSYPLMRHLYRRADAVITYGPHVSRYVSRYRHSPDTTFIAPQAVDSDVFGRPVSDSEIAAWREEVGVPEGPLVLYVGRLVKEKGVEDLLAAWRRLRPAANSWLCLVGEGPLERLARDGVPNVAFAGWLSQERLPVAYAAADLLVVPSITTRLFLEPWGLVCNEAMSQGRPVIATTAVGAAPGGLVKDGETGLVVPERDEAALAEAIGRLLEDAELRERLGRRAREVVADYNYDRAADAFGRAFAACGLISGS